MGTARAPLLRIPAARYVVVMTLAEDAAPIARRKREVPPGVFLVLGVVVVPALIALATPWGFEPGTSTFVYVAFAVVAGQTVAVLTAVGVLVAAIVRRGSASRVLVFAGITVFVIAIALSTINTLAAQIVSFFPG
jgi:hypothetical protein